MNKFPWIHKQGTSKEKCTRSYPNHLSERSKIKGLMFYFICCLTKTSFKSHGIHMRASFSGVSGNRPQGIWCAAELVICPEVSSESLLCFVLTLPVFLHCLKSRHLFFPLCSESPISTFITKSLSNIQQFWKKTAEPSGSNTHTHTHTYKLMSTAEAVSTLQELLWPKRN